MSNELTPEQIHENWLTFKKFSKKVGDYDNRLELVEKMLDKYEERLIFCPASNNTAYHNAFPGGLVDHTLGVLKFALQIRKVVDSTCPQESLIMAALFHDLGKLGDEISPYYLDQDSNWHRERGLVYKFNPKVQYMPVPNRSLYLLQLNGIKLTYDEYVAILIHDGQYVNENKSWAMKEPTMSLILHQADILANKREKGEL